MPHFAWHGVNLMGNRVSGSLFARSEQDLDARLFKKDIALLACKQKYPSLLSKPITALHIIHFFKQLAVLLDTGILLPQALTIVNEQTENPLFQEIVYTISMDVDQGVSLSEALIKHPALFDTLMVHMVYVGQETGSLAQSLQLLCHYLQARYEFRKQLKAAALLPLLTLGFFVVVALVIFIAVIPRFVVLFASVGKALPPLTRGIIALSSFITSWAMLGVVCVLTVAIGFSMRFMRTQRGANMMDSLYLRMPFVGTIVQRSCIAYYTRALAMLLQAGLPIVTAVRMSKYACTNVEMCQRLAYLEQEIESGASLQEAMAHQAELFTPELIAMVGVGQESGRLSSMLAYAADTCDAQVKRALTTVTTLFQPLLMLLLGGLVTLLIFAVYIPIFNLSQALG
jgi:type IV pilus assembly protein PilC